MRWHALRKARPDLVPALLQEGSHVWTFSNPANPWGSRERISMERLAQMVDAAEAAAGVDRKSPQPERGGQCLNANVA
ncbi:MAG TPA: hypothetical protein VN736_28780 [Candidatus Limnocylindrales bacterium]|nr:hypothetical protein [Candidatus Limnocylindrales bacterium]